MLKNKQKSGSVILLALMIMSVILSSTLYINTLSIRSMKQSKNIDNSIVAFYAAETGNEQAIYYIRKVDDFDISSLNFSPSFPNPGGVLTMKSLISRDVEESVRNILISLKKDETYQLDIFDQNNINLASDIVYLELNWNSSYLNSKIELTANEWEPSNMIDWKQMQDQMHINKCLLNESPVTVDGSGSICSDIKLDRNMSYQFRFKALNCDIYNLSIKAFELGGQQIDFKNIYSIESVGEYPLNTNESNRQALRVNLRKSSPLSGLFDYVLFSEKSLVKDSDIYGGWFSEELFISTNSLPDATVDVLYSHAMRAVNGEVPYRWSWSGAIPPGLDIDRDTGIISGRPSGPSQTYPVTITVEDSSIPPDGPVSDSKILFLKVN